MDNKTPKEYIDSLVYSTGTWNRLYEEQSVQATRGNDETTTTRDVQLLRTAG